MQALSKQQRIQSAAMKLFKQQGVEATSVNEIVRLADVAKGTFYIYYKNKEELVSLILTRQHGCLLNTILNKAFLRYAGDAKILKIAFVDELIFYYLKHPKLLKTFQRNITFILDTVEHRKQVFGHIQKLDAFLEIFARPQESKKQAMNRFMLMMEIISIVCYNAVFFQYPDEIDDVLPELKITVIKMIESEEEPYDL